MTQAAFSGVLAALAACLAVTAIALRTDRTVASRAGFRDSSPTLAASRFRRALETIGSNAFLGRLGRTDRLAGRLALSGCSWSLEETVGAKSLACAATLSLALLSPSPAPLLSPLLGIVAFRAPDLAVAARAKKRSAEANHELPQLLDLLAAASAAGLSGPAALRRAVGAIRGPLADDLTVVIAAVELGGRWREELRKAADRLDLPDLKRAVGALTRSETLGASLSEAVTELAVQVRETRRATASERARTAPVKMLFPLVFLVLPAFLLLTVVPVLLTTLQSIR